MNQFSLADQLTTAKLIQDKAGTQEAALYMCWLGWTLESALWNLLRAHKRDEFVIEDMLPNYMGLSCAK